MNTIFKYLINAKIDVVYTSEDYMKNIYEFKVFDCKIKILTTGEMPLDEFKKIVDKKYLEHQKK